MISNFERTFAHQEISPERPFWDLLKTRLDNAAILTDNELVDTVNESARDVGEPDVFDKDDKRPKIFYRALPPNAKVQEILEGEAFVTRPFSYCLPGTTKDLPFAYGGNEPILIRIIDNNHEWEDTGPYWGAGEGWNEALNLDPVILKKVHEETQRASDLYRQVGSDAQVETRVKQVTYVVDKEATRKMKEERSLEPFKEDVGFLKEIEQRAIDLAASRPDTPMRRLNQKYFEYFDALMKIDANSVQDAVARRALTGAQATISDLIDRLEHTPKDDLNWTEEEVRDLLSRFSSSEKVKEYLEIAKQF